MNANAAIQGYSRVKVDASVQGANPHYLIQMLFEGLLERIAQAKGAMQQGNIELKGKKINDAVKILMGLKDSLDVEQGGDLALNLEALYDYVQRTLLKAHLNNEETLLDECSGLIADISAAWRQIG